MLTVYKKKVQPASINKHFWFIKK